MLKLSFRYDQTSARLQVEGVPDFSQGQSQDVLGILSSWNLQLVGSPELEGKLEHLQAMMSTVLPYARYRLSGVRRTFGNQDSPISISAKGDEHQLTLRSSQPDTQPLSLYLDDSELSDLVRCLDSLRIDTRVQLIWGIPIERPLPRQELVRKLPILKRLSAPFLGGLIFLVVAVIGISIPTPSEKVLDIKEFKSEL